MAAENTSLKSERNGGEPSCIAEKDSCRLRRRTWLRTVPLLEEVKCAVSRQTNRKIRRYKSPQPQTLRQLAPKATSSHPPHRRLNRPRRLHQQVTMLPIVEPTRLSARSLAPCKQPTADCNAPAPATQHLQVSRTNRDVTSDSCPVAHSTINNSPATPILPKKSQTDRLCYDSVASEVPSVSATGCLRVGCKVASTEFGAEGTTSFTSCHSETGKQSSRTHLETDVADPSMELASDDISIDKRRQHHLCS